MSVIRHHRRSSYTIIPNELYEDRRLNWQSIGLMGYLLSRPDDWDVRLHHLASLGFGGREATRAARRRLADAGWVVETTEHNAKGEIRTVTWVFDTPDNTERDVPITPTDIRETRSPVNPDDGSTDVGEPVCKPSTESPSTEGPSTEGQGTLLPDADASSGGEDSEDDPAKSQFDDHFWPTYPYTNGRKPEMGLALMKWRKLSLEQRRRALIGARNLAASGRTPKYAHRFLSRNAAGDYPFDEWQEPTVAAVNSPPARHGGQRNGDVELIPTDEPGVFRTVYYGSGG